jgi:hypothetical protein
MLADGTAPHIATLLDSMRSTRQDLFNVWTVRKQRLDQCFQLKLFEQDADKVDMNKTVWA